MEGIVQYTIANRVEKDPKKKKPVKKDVPSVKSVGNWYGYRKKEFIEITGDMLLPVLKKNIILRAYNQRTENHQNKDPKYFYISVCFKLLNQIIRTGPIKFSLIWLDPQP